MFICVYFSQYFHVGEIALRVSVVDLGHLYLSCVRMWSSLEYLICEVILSAQFNRYYSTIVTHRTLHLLKKLFKKFNLVLSHLKEL